jgi:NAD(P)-dependent dehydrogenase (short-subunit alcohol dehydrogenase family)
LARLKDKVALISGAGSGIGKTTALLFAKEGALLSVVDWNLASAADTVAAIQANGGHAISIKADVSKAAEVKSMIQKTIQAYGQIDILFNNAGVMQPLKTTVETSEEDWDRVIDINLKGTFLALKYGIPEMIKCGGGSIINSSSMAGLLGFPYMPAYAASKAGIVLLTKSAALEYAGQNIRINCICPGTIKTPMAASLAKEPNLKNYEPLRKQIPLGRRGTPTEIARAVLFLASDDASYITGTALNIDGGVIAR